MSGPRLPHLPALDGLRAVAVLLVVTVHASPVFAGLQGWRGVTIFFVLSGYLITSLALAEEAVDHGRPEGGVDLHQVAEAHGLQLIRWDNQQRIGCGVARSRRPPTKSRSQQ